MGPMKDILKLRRSITATYFSKKKETPALCQNSARNEN